MILEDDCPDEAQNDGRLAIDDVRNVYVDQFNLRSDKQGGNGDAVSRDQTLRHR